MSSGLTEEQAKEKWCPLTMSIPLTDLQESGPYKYYASECMAWHWTIYEWIPPEGGLSSHMGKPTHGCCGMKNRLEMDE